MTTATIPKPQANVRALIGYGVLGGIIAGITFAAFEMVVAVVLDGAPAFFMPMRMIGGIAIGRSALDPATPLLAPPASVSSSTWRSR